MERGYADVGWRSCTDDDAMEDGVQQNATVDDDDDDTDEVILHRDDPFLGVLPPHGSEITPILQPRKRSHHRHRRPAPRHIGTTEAAPESAPRHHERGVSSESRRAVFGGRFGGEFGGRGAQGLYGGEEGTGGGGGIGMATPPPQAMGPATPRPQHTIRRPTQTQGQIETWILSCRIKSSRNDELCMRPRYIQCQR
jgi:hypothetical protein